jgi:hypothetical protein
LAQAEAGTVRRGSTIMALKRGPNSLKNGPNSLKRGQCYVIFGQNDAAFRRNLLASNELPLWWIPTINKPNHSKNLRPIMVDTPAIDCHNSLFALEMQIRAKSEKMGSVLQCITKLASSSAARGVFSGSSSAHVGPAADAVWARVATRRVMVKTIGRMAGTPGYFFGAGSVTSTVCNAPRSREPTSATSP